MYILTLTNKQTNEVHTYDNVIDINDGEKLYYRFQINTLGLADGEYDLELTKDGILVGVNTLYVGDYETYSLQYKRGDNTFIDITLNAKLEDTTAEINVEKFTLLPSEGYDGFEKVEIDATPLYDVAFGDGYASGNTDGISQGIEIQKELLESIVINENGTYSREDGYNEIVVDVPDLNGSYDEGYSSGYTDGEAAGIENAGAIIAETARVLDITENGTYVSQYSDPIYPDVITGVYPDGENFYDYAYISKRGYNTNIYPNPTTKIEFWWRFDGTIEQGGTGEGLIIGSHYWGQTASIFKIGFNLQNKALIAAIGSSDPVEFSIPDNNWHHYIMSFEDGLIIDGEQIGVFGNNLTGTSTYEPICINGYYGNNKLNADDFGMVIVDGTIYIPTADGFMNYTTNEYLPIINNYDGSYTYTQVKPEYITPTGNLIKTVNVNVVPKIDVAENGIKLGYSTFTQVPDFYDFSNVTDMSYMFSNCESLQILPLINTINVINMNNMFQGCSNLQTLDLIDTSKVTNMSNMFYSCSSVQTIPQLDTSNVTTMNRMFYKFGGMQSLISLPKFNVPKLTDIGAFFYSREVTMNNLTEVGGWENLKCNWNDNGGLFCLPNLTYQSCINILNGLYDFTGNGETPTSSQGQLKVHQNFLTTVGDEISIGTNKGWTITA